MKFLRDLQPRLAGRIQLTTDGHLAYPDAVQAIFGGEIDYATLVTYHDEDTHQTSQRISGWPGPRHISTSYVELQNLTLRMALRRYTRRTLAFSKKIDCHIRSVSLHYLHYNFCWLHEGLGGITPAMAAGVSDHLWGMNEVVVLVRASRPKPGPRGSYRKVSRSEKIGNL